jgi:hypothetical protein
MIVPRQVRKELLSKKAGTIPYQPTSGTGIQLIIHQSYEGEHTRIFSQLVMKYESLLQRYMAIHRHSSDNCTSQIISNYW